MGPITRVAVALLMVGIALVGGCSKPEAKPKLSPDELIHLLRTSYVDAEKAGSFTNQPGWEMNVKLRFDGEEGYTAVRFPSVEQARDYCQTQEAGVALDYWCLDTSKSKTSSDAWMKVIALGKAGAAKP